ncbi:hypothetical protein Csa_002416, partial [Cucumis sativus]
ARGDAKRRENSKGKSWLARWPVDSWCSRATDLRLEFIVKRRKARLDGEGRNICFFYFH